MHSWKRILTGIRPPVLAWRANHMKNSALNHADQPLFSACAAAINTWEARR
jgi:hypothetical protein